MTSNPSTGTLYLIPGNQQELFWGDKACFILDFLRVVLLMPQLKEAWGSDIFGKVHVLRACLKSFETFPGIGLTHVQGYGGKGGVGTINRGVPTACRLEVRWGTKMKGGWWRPECAVASVNLKVPFQVHQISSSSSYNFVFGNTFYLVLDCFALALYHRTFKQRYKKACIAWC